MRRQLNCAVKALSATAATAAALTCTGSCFHTPVLSVSPRTAPLRSSTRHPALSTCAAAAGYCTPAVAVLPLRSSLTTGSGASSPALFRTTRISRIPPQLARLLILGGTAVLQVFLVAFQRESRRLKYETESDVGAAPGYATAQRRMSGVEALQVLGLDRSAPQLFSEVQKAESNTAQPASSTLLPLTEGKAREEAKRNFERMFALAVKEENLFLAGKLSAAYRVCVDPEWDQVEEVEEGAESSTAQDENERKQ